MIQVADAFDSIDLALLFMQIIAICQMFNVPWPEALLQLMNIFSIANFDVESLLCLEAQDAIRIECARALISTCKALPFGMATCGDFMVIDIHYI